jgi:nucleoside-diphosphate-sugar epimerase
MIRWIIPDKLGTAPEGDYIAERGDVKVDTRTLVDKHGNSAAALRDKIDEGLSGLKAGYRVIIVCDFGVSRSNTIAVGVLAKLQNVAIDAAVNQVIQATGESSIKLEMIEDLRAALDSISSERKVGHVLVTGGAGFLGASVALRLSETHTVFTPTRAQLDLAGPTSRLDHYCRENGISTIVHFAYPRVYTNNTAMGESLTILRNVVDVCKVRNIRLIQPSGSVVFSGYPNSSIVADIGTTPRPKGVYGQTKFFEEMLVRNAVENEGVSATIVRISPVYGRASARPRLIWFARQYIQENKPVITHAYRNDRPRLQLLHADDAVAGVVEVIRSGHSPIYHLAGQASYETCEIVRRIGHILGREAHIEEIQIAEDISNVFLDSSGSNELLGWKPVVDLDTGLMRTLLD